jgi:hypothetical protein
MRLGGLEIDHQLELDLGYEIFPADAAKWWPIITQLGIKAE